MIPLLILHRGMLWTRGTLRKESDRCCECRGAILKGWAAYRPSTNAKGRGDRMCESCARRKPMKEFTP